MQRHHQTRLPDVFGNDSQIPPPTIVPIRSDLPMSSNSFFFRGSRRDAYGEYTRGDDSVPFFNGSIQ